MPPVPASAEQPPAGSDDSAAATPTPAAAAAAAARLDRSVVKGVAWTSAAKWLTQALRWVSTLLIARLLTPGDYGLVGMATVFVGLAQLVNEFGLGAAIVQDRSLDRAQVARLGGLSVLFGLAFALVGVAAAAPIAAFYDEPALRAVVLVLSTTFAIRGLQVLPRSLLQRNLEYRRLAAVDVAEAVGLAGATLGLALAGFGYWALVLGNVAGALCSTLACLLWRPHAIAWPNDFARIRAAVTYGMHVVSGRLAWYAYSNADFLIVGKVLGRAALGAYSFGWTLAMIPVERVTSLLSRVTYATFVRVQDDHAALRRYVRGFTEAIALLTFPAAVGTALVADLLVRVALGPQWEEAIVPLRILTISTLLRSVLPLLPQVLLAIGQAKRSRDQNLVLALTLPPLFLLASRWGLVAVAAVWVVGYPAIAIATMLRAACRAIGLPMRAYWGALWPAASATGLMGLAVLGARALVPWGLLPEKGRLASTLVGCVGVGALAYAGALLALHRPRLDAMRRLLAGGARA